MICITSGNEFGSKEFVKLPYKFFPLDIDYGADDEEMVGYIHTTFMFSNTRLRFIVLIIVRVLGRGGIGAKYIY